MVKIQGTIERGVYSVTEQHYSGVSAGRAAVGSLLELVEVVEAPGFTTEERESAYDIRTAPVELMEELYLRILETERKTEEHHRVALVRIEKGSSFGDLARYMEAREFKGAWYQNYTDTDFALEMEAEYGPYERESQFLLLLDTEAFDGNGLPGMIGVARLSGKKEQLLKTLHDTPDIWGLSKPEILDDMTKCDSEICKKYGKVGDPEHTWDCSSLAINEDYRGSEALPIMIHELYIMSLEKGISTITSILVEKFYNLFRFRGIPFRAIANAEPKIHMGELSVPVVMHLPEISEMLSKQDNPRAASSYMKMALGRDLEEYTTVSV